jgi:RsiW-degrading membrane proteinase PrsW (M82 family)
MGLKKFAFALLALFLLFPPIIFSDEIGDKLADFGNALEASVRIENTELRQNPQTITATFDIYNPLEEPMPLYILREDPEKGWQIVKILGGLAPQSYSRLQLDIEARYEKISQKTTRYAIVGRSDDGKLYGKFFEIEEDWTKYEKEISDSLTSALVVFIPLVGAAVIAAVIVISQSAYAESRSARLKRAAKGRYAFPGLIPETKGRPFSEIAATLMAHPIIMAFEMSCVFLFAALIADAITTMIGGEEALKVIALSAVGAFAVPFAYTVLSWYILKKEERKPFQIFAGMFSWGMFVAFLAFIINTMLVGELKNIATGAYIAIGVIFITPIVEEILKGIGIFILSGHREYNDTLSGMLFGFACGAGFAFVENWFYFSLKANPFDLGMSSWAVFVLYRSFFNTLAHGCFTAALSTIPGYIKSIGSLRKYAPLTFIPGIVLAITIHSIFNVSAVLDQALLPNRETIFFTFNPLVIILLGALFFLTLVLAIIDEKKRKYLAEMAEKKPLSSAA